MLYVVGNILLCRLMCSNVMCVVENQLEVIPMIWNQLGSMSTTWKQDYSSL